MRNRFSRLGLESKSHYKLYKSGRRWVAAGITVFSVGVGLTFSQVEQAKAATDTSTDEAENSTNVSSNATTATKNTVVLKSSGTATTTTTDTKDTTATTAAAKATTSSVAASSTAVSSAATSSTAASSTVTASTTVSSAATSSTATSSAVKASTTVSSATTSSTAASKAITASTIVASAATANTTASSTATKSIDTDSTSTTTLKTATSANYSVDSQGTNTTSSSVANTLTSAATASQESNDTGAATTTTTSDAVSGIVSAASSTTPITRSTANKVMTMLATKSTIQAVAALTSDAEAQATVSLVTTGAVSMSYSDNGASIMKLGQYISSPDTTPDNDIAYYIQDASGNYLEDINGQKVNLLYLLFLDEEHVNSYFDITYTDRQGQVTNYAEGTDLESLKQAGNYAITLNATGKAAMSEVIQGYASYYDLSGDVDVTDYVPTFSTGASDYTFTLQILPATIKATTASDGLAMNIATQPYTGSLTMLPTSLTVKDGASVNVLQIKNGVISHAEPGVAGTVGQTVLTSADFTYTYQGTGTNLTEADVGVYTLTLNAAGRAAIQAALGSNYILDADAVFTKPTNRVTAAELGLTTASDTVTYDGKAHGTSVSVTSGTAYDQFDFTTPTGTNVGSYAMTYELNDATQAAILAKNYTVTATDGTLVITPEDMTVTVNDSNVDYDGQAHGTTASVTSGTNYDDLVFTAVATDGSGATSYTNAGSYAMTGATTAAAGNYNISYVNGTITINKVNANITIPSKIYWNDGTEKNLTAVVAGTVNGETLNYSVTDGLSAVGTKTITANYDAADPVNQNYTITVVPGTLTIGDIAVQYLYEHTDAAGKTQVDSTATGTATHGSDAMATDYLTYSTAEKPKTGYTLVSDDTGVAPNGTLANSGGTVTYIYLANTETATVAYVDQTTGATIKTEPLQGAYGTTDTYTTADKIAAYENAGYELVSSTFPTTGVVYDEDGTVKSYTVTLKHKFVTVTPDNPGTPDQPIAPANPDGPKYPAGTTAADLTTSVSQTIKYQYQNGDSAATDNVQTVTFKRSATVDEVDGTLVYTAWLNGDSTTAYYPAVASPVITGYTADKPNVTSTDSVTGTDLDTVVIVTYKVNTEKATVAYVDTTTGQTIKTEPLQGAYGTTDTYTTADKIAAYENAGYELVSSTFPTTGVVYDEDGTVKSYTVTLKHKFVTVTPDNPGTPDQPIDPANPDGPKYPAGTTAADLTTSVSQTIKYQYQNGDSAATDNVQTVTFKRSATVDEVDGTLVYTDWLNGDSTTAYYPAVASPVITGYTADKPNVTSTDSVTGTDLDTVVIVTYKVNTEKATVAYVDTTTGQTIKTEPLQGAYGTTDTYTTADTIAAYENDGYELVSSTFPTAGVVYDEDGTVKSYTVTLKHKFVTVTPDNPGTPDQPIDPANPDGPKYPAGTTAADLTTSVSQTIKYQYQNGDSAATDNVQTMTFKRSATIDEVDGTLVYTDWLNGDSTTAYYPAVASPVITGYTADKPNVTSTDSVTGTDLDTVVIVTYKVNTEKATVAYVDTTTGQTLYIADVKGDYNTQSTYRTAETIAKYVKAGYELVGDNYPTNGIMFDEDGTVKSYTVTLKHKLVTVTPADPGTPGQPIDPANPDGPKYPAGTTAADLTTSVSQTIKYQYQNGAVASADNVQTVTFNRNATIDEVDNTLVYTAWQTGDAATGRYVTVMSPVITGYTADKPSVAGNDAVASTDSNTTSTVTYRVNTEKATVMYVDQTTGQTIKTEPLQGAYGTTDAYTTTDTIAAYENDGYELVSSTFPTAGVVYDEDGTVKSYTVTLKHKFVTVTPDNPGTPDQPIDPANPDGPKYPAGTTAADLTTSVSQTIKYQYQNGAVAGADNVQTITFNRNVTLDEVDGTLVYTDWLNGDVATTGSYNTVASSVLTGYTADKTSIAGNDAVTSTAQDTTVVVTYTANPETATVTYIDATTGQTLDIKTLTGDFNTSSDYRTTDTIANYIKVGYALVASDYPATGVMFDEDGTVKTYTVTLKHKMMTVTPTDPGTPGQPIDPANPDGPKYPAGTTTQALTKQVSQTIKYQYQNGDTLGTKNVQTITFNRNATIDEVDGTLVYTAWVTGNSETGHYEAVDSPVITGYTADKMSIAGNNVANTAQDTTEIVTYTANSETATVTYIDTTTGQILDVVTLTGDFATQSAYRTTDMITKYVKNGYVLGRDEYPASGATFNADGVVRNYFVRLAHAIDSTTATKTITQTVHYQNMAGTQLHADTVRTITFIRVKTIDRVTGEITYGNWSINQAGNRFETVAAISIPGYQPTTTGTQVVTVTPGSADDVQTIRYVADTPATSETPKTPAGTITIKTPDKVNPGKPTPPKTTKQVVQAKQPGNIDQSIRTAIADETTVKLAKSAKTVKAMPDRKSTATHKQARLPQTNDDRQASVAAELLGLTAATLLVGLGALLKKHRD
ncbi:mucin-binding protein [Lactiplantibacillus paraplantarum]|uniref:mucin-binding protein n=2 Tax=Lactiplantibacillus paraplantarum TaxID=60520 RepID=UPI0021D24466|nr:KxYKxGKxW signal peptide domain-containing protein [Lactiplantibacillus paraplantarum]MCU4683625.1 KxYKxGKxW signal peptide domain-containing protein [Lactiplantibacillus paraplantarum]